MKASFLNEIKDFYDYLMVNATLKEKKAIITLGSVDFLLIFNLVYICTNENIDFNDIFYNFIALGGSSSLLFLILFVYFDKYNLDKCKGKIRKK